MVDSLPLPSLVSIRAFEAAARLGSFAAAARELGTTAASVSYHVRQLERQGGMILFHRLPHRVELTGPGRLIAQETSDAFNALRRAFAAAGEIDQSRLALTALPTFGTSWLTPRLGRFRAEHPSIRIELDLSAEPRDLNAGVHDAAIRNGHGRWPGLRAVALFPSLFTPLCAPALIAAAAGLAVPRMPPEPPLLGRPDWWALWRRALGYPEPLSPDRFGVTFADEYLDASAAIAGHGVTIGSPILFAAEIAARRLVPVHDLVVSDGRGFWLVYPAARRGSAKIVRLQQWLLGEATQAREAARPFLDRMVVLPSDAPSAGGSSIVTSPSS
jgi:LysR family glycine cleavage system transcriptional activator